MQQHLNHLATGHDLKRDEMFDAMQTIMRGEATDAQIGAFLMGLRCKGETPEELAAATDVMRNLATRVKVDPAMLPQLVDTCGTGGDGAKIFNVSTATAIVVGAAGGHVAKHGNRSISSSSGSADVLEAAGVNLDISPEGVAKCIDEIGVGFMFAPSFHGAMKHAIGPRKELGMRTLFNLIGPLTNPAGAPNQVIGVFDRAWLSVLCETLYRLGSRHVMVIHSDDDLDEISVADRTRVAELADGLMREYDINPADYGLAHKNLDDLRVDTAQQSLDLIRQVFDCKPGCARDIIVINAAAALYVSGKAEDLEAGIALAQQAIDTGKAKQTLEKLAQLSHEV